MSGAVPDLRSNGSIPGHVARSQASGHGGLSSSGAVAGTRPVAKIGSAHDYAVKASANDAAPRKEGNFAKRLKKDSVAGFDMNKKVKVSKNFFHGKATGNFQVIGTKGWGVVPPQWYLTICTLFVTIGPSII